MKYIKLLLLLLMSVIFLYYIIYNGFISNEVFAMEPDPENAEVLTKTKKVSFNDKIEIFNYSVEHPNYENPEELHNFWWIQKTAHNLEHWPIQTYYCFHSSIQDMVIIHSHYNNNSEISTYCLLSSKENESVIEILFFENSDLLHSSNKASIKTENTTFHNLLKLLWNEKNTDKTVFKDIEKNFVKWYNNPSTNSKSDLENSLNRTVTKQVKRIIEQHDPFNTRK